MRERRKITANEEDNFNVFDSQQLAEVISSSTKVMTSLLGAVAGVSLLVGGIGIMNIMLVSVTERTREIGIRLAIGARAREVLLQFLVEAVTLSCVGGVAGIVLAYGLCDHASRKSSARPSSSIRRSISSPSSSPPPSASSSASCPPAAPPASTPSTRSGMSESRVGN